MHFFLAIDAAKSWVLQQSTKIGIEHILHTTNVDSSYNYSKSALFEKRKKKEVKFVTREDGAATVSCSQRSV